MSVYLVTGVSRGLGLEWVDDLSRSDPAAIVIGVARNPDKAPQLQELLAARKNFHIIKGDVTSQEDVKHIVAETARIGGGKLDYLINNAGAIDEPHSIFETPVEDYVTMFDINVLGTIRLTIAALPLIRAGSKKVIFHASSFIGSSTWILEQKSSFPNAPYCVSKAALNMFNVKFAKEVEADGSGIVAVCVSPGYVNTDMNKDKPGTISVSQSITSQKRVLYGLTPADNGKFYDQEGTPLPF